ncbi:MAG: serine--tRNA ligase [Bacteroidota bacterium]
MLQISAIRENRELTVKGLQKKHFKDAEARVDEAIKLDDSRREAQLALNQLQSEINAASNEIGKLMKSGDKASAETARAEVAAKKQSVKELETQMAEAAGALDALMVLLPNLPHESVPEGRTPEENEVALEWGAIPTLPDSALPHWEIIKKLDIIDFELGNKIAAAGFPVYKGKGARLQRALVNFFLDEATKAGYIEVQPPILVNADSAYGTGQLPDKEGQMYHDAADNLYLIPTAEVPITNIYRDVLLREADLPVKNAGYTPCFRREAGSWGAHVRGLNRLHQFDKVEIVRVEMPADSYAALEEMSLHVQGLLQKLELPYRVLHLCGGDMSFGSALTYDMEVYSAAQKRWLEVSSVSNFETFQANRLKLRLKSDDKKSQLLHTLNGSALALPRIVAALLENNQTEDGRIRLPEVLHAYTGFGEI